MITIIPVSIAMAEVTSTQDVINNQSITNFNEESIIECVDEIIPVSIALAEVTSTHDVINNQSITNFNEECLDETLNETVDETLNEAINETFNEAINETFNDTNLIEDEDELFLVLQPPQQVSTLNFLDSVDFFLKISYLFMYNF